MKKIFSVLFLIFMIFGGRAYAQDESPLDTGKDAAAEEKAPAGDIYHFPVIAPEGKVLGGYAFVDHSGSSRADEYYYLHDSILFGGELRIFSFPHRLHLDIDFRNKKDYFGDVGYAYKDTVLFRGINRTLFHNLDNILLVGPTATVLPTGALLAPTGTQAVYVKDAGEEYGVKWGMTTVFLRFKTPNYPFHVFLDGNIIDRDGTQQQRFLGGSGSFDNIVRVSESRDINWLTKNLTIGTNAHLGPVEIELSHGEKRLDASDSIVLYDYYTASARRNEGVYAHNLIPNVKGSSNTVRVHTSYTGRLVASATLTKVDRKNRDSDTETDYFIGAGEVSWTAATNLAVFVRYRHKEIDADNPSSVTVTNLSDPTDVYLYTVKPSISSITDNASATVRYRPFSLLTLRAAYNYNRIRREDYEEWDLPQKTRYNTASLSANVRIMRNLNLRAGYAHKAVSDPAYNTEPNHSNEGHVSVSWTPVQKIIGFASYSIAKEKRDDLNTVGTTTAKNRDVRKDSAMGALTYLASDKVSLTASYTYIHDKIRQDIVFGTMLEPMVPDTDMAHSYGLNMNYTPSSHINLGAGVNYTVSSGAFSLTDPTLLEPISVASLSAVKTRETECSLSGEYRFRKGLSAGVRYRYIDFNDVLDNPWDDLQDGQAHIVMLTLSKEW